MNDMALVEFPTSKIQAVNVSVIPQRSPLRYPGGKTWLIPHIREWLSRTTPDILIDPFTGGGIVPLTAIMEGLVRRCVMIELDRDVAAFWNDALHVTDAIIRKIQGFRPTRRSVQALERQEANGFRTLVLNRTRKSGILAPGAAFIKNGENGKGIQSRWYPDTLIRRLEAIAYHADKITFRHDDGLEVLMSLAYGLKTTAVFLDPPYTAGGKRAGTRLYSHNDVDHQLLFELLADSDVNFLMTYDCAPEIMNLIHRHGFHAASVQMMNAHHNKMLELVITREKMFT